MSTASIDNWHTANQHYLVAELARIRRALEWHAAHAQGEPNGHERPADPPTALVHLSAPPALERVCNVFGLSPFERDIVLLCAGSELDATFAGLCATAQGDPQRPYPTFSLALAALSEPHWSALTPAAPLRHWRLIEVDAGAALTTRPLRIDERVLHELVGVGHVDERLVPLVDPVGSLPPLGATHQALAQQISTIWRRATSTGTWPVIELCGDDEPSKRGIAAAACAALELNVWTLSADMLPTLPHELDTLLCLWEREAVLSNSALLLVGDAVPPDDFVRASMLARVIERLHGALLVSTTEPRHNQRRPVLRFDVLPLSMREQRALWQSSLAAQGAHLNGEVERLVGQFSLSATAIQNASADVGSHDQTPLDTRLWQACQVQARPRLDGVAQRIAHAATWDDLVLPPAQTQTLREIATHTRHRATVYETWGFGNQGTRGLGISALFSGPSGTGKTLAAEVLAHALDLDLYSIDLSQVVSKYIGETEKNLRRVFDAAEAGGAVLLFDEADALFGKRSDVKDSHDRYANIEVSYLLQRMEAYRGLAILTTNMKGALDPAFLRRIRFVVPFPFPDATQRAEIWRRIFPPATPTEALDAEQLAHLNIAGGNIRNIALNAAFLAADGAGAVTMQHILRAARSEYAKLEKPLTDTEIGGWR